MLRWRKRVDWEQRCADLYQVIGYMAYNPGAPTNAEIVRALDYAAGKRIDGELLPWPREVVTSQTSRQAWLARSGQNPS